MSSGQAAPGRSWWSRTTEAGPRAARLHAELVERGCQFVLGPYGSDSARAVAAARTGAVVWNHGAAADDVQRLPGVVSVPSPASRYLLLRLHLCELELRTGDLDSASLLLAEWAESSDHDLQFRPQYQRCRALLAAERGDAEQAKRWATEAIERARATGCRWDELEARRARAMAGLVGQRPEEAVEDLRSVWDHCEREGVLEPGVFPVAPELVEALAELHEVETAEAVTERLGQLAEQQEHPWARAAEKRCHAIATLASSQQDVIAATLLREAADDFERLGLRFDAARCQLALGRALRRAKRWRDARETLEAAMEAFAALKSTGWEDRARAELSRVGARRPRSDGAELTPSERRVVELAAEGLANKQIASTLYVSVNTVEVHLVHAYAKLGVHSRTQLARALVTGS